MVVRGGDGLHVGAGVVLAGGQAVAIGFMHLGLKVMWIGIPWDK